MTEFLQHLVTVLDAIVVVYVCAFFLTNLAFVPIALMGVSRSLKREQVNPARDDRLRKFLPKITLLVPAYNEEVTIEESVKSLLRLDYPSFEIVICNDGSKDGTVDVLRKAFNLVQTDMEVPDLLPTATVRGYYISRAKLPRGLSRIVLVDKENGGKADALNASINVAEGDFVTSMDADSLLVPDALLLSARPIAEDPEGVIAVGVQVGISNGSLVEDGRVVETRLPQGWLARFQIVEYMRSFTQGRVALASLESLLILSGVFALMRRDMVLAIGGFLTRTMRSRIGIEYCGPGAHTVCEDMEVVVRLHRYVLDKKVPGRVTILPFPVAWTECPENWKDLGKQRSRWYRGLLEVLVYHRKMIFRPKFKQIGLFSLPYQLIFEAAAPLVECLGYVVLLVTLGTGLLSASALLGFLALAMAMHLCLSTLSVSLCIVSESGARAQHGRLALFSYARVTDVILLVIAGMLSNFGYRQYLVAWQLKGFWDFLRGKKGWDKFARKGFATGTT